MEMPTRTATTQAAPVPPSDALLLPSSRTALRHPPQHPQHHTVSRAETVRVLLQALDDLGYAKSAQCLADESGVQVESRAVSTLRGHLREGRWSDAVQVITTPAVPFRSSVHRQQALLEVHRQRWGRRLCARIHNEHGTLTYPSCCYVAMPPCVFVVVVFLLLLWLFRVWYT